MDIDWDSSGLYTPLPLIYETIKDLSRASLIDSRSEEWLLANPAGGRSKEVHSILGARRRSLPVPGDVLWAKERA